MSESGSPTTSVTDEQRRQIENALGAYATEAIGLHGAVDAIVDAFTRLVPSGRRVAVLEEALQWVCDHARDEEALSERAVCGNAFHKTYPQVNEPNRTCPDCCSSWWATDGSLPTEEGSYALEAVARAALGDRA